MKKNIQQGCQCLLDAYPIGGNVDYCPQAKCDQQKNQEEHDEEEITCQKRQEEQRRDQEIHKLEINQK
jgi:hypothetical protein